MPAVPKSAHLAPVAKSKHRAHEFTPAIAASTGVENGMKIRVPTSALT